MGVADPKIIFDRELIEERDYWHATLSKCVGLSTLRSDYPRPEGHLGVLDTVDLELPPEVSQRLSKLTRGSPFLLYVTLMAALKVCLHRYVGGGVSSIVVASPALDEDVSQPANLLMILDEVQGRLSFRQLLLNIRQTLLDAYARQRYPFERLMRDLELVGAEDEGVVSGILLALENVHSHIPPVRCEVTMTFAQEQERVCGKVVFNADVFRRDTIDRFVGHFTNVLRAGAQDPLACISDLQMLPESEQRQLLVDWNDTGTEIGVESSISELFEDRVTQAPDVVAAVCGDNCLTYQELNRRANQLAHYLMSLGTGPEQRIGICTQRSLDMLVGLLGILKTGAAYVPLDPLYPPSRLSYLLEDAQVFIILTQSHLAERLPDCEAGRVFLDTDWNAISGESQENPGRKMLPNSLAYVIYTSGSTGLPKGVMVSRRNLLNHALALLRVYGINATCRLLQFVSLSFDAAGEEIFPILLGGGTLVLPIPDLCAFDVELWQFCEQQQINILHMPAPVWHSGVSVLTGGRLHPPRSLDLVLVGGESPAVDKLCAWAQLTEPHTRFLNAYGPTEATITATLFETTSGATSTAMIQVPIGRPIFNVQIYILDANLHTVPVGGIGELFIGGAGVARGYLDHPRMTAEFFIPDPFGHEPGGRLYRTGDLARYLPDGNIEFVGRSDDQVKMRGFRIELNEVTAMLVQHPQVREALTLIREDGRGDKCLVAYIVPESASHPSPDDLAQFLKALLPVYMVPSAFLLLDALPLTPHGKIDRRVLPAPDDASTPGAVVAFVPPRTLIEEMVAEIWADVLGLGQIGIHDNFFDRGGHSLLATQVVSRVRDGFQVELSLRHLFRAPTVAGVAAEIEATIRKGRQQRGSILLPESRGEISPLSFAQERLWFLEQLEPNNSRYNIPVAVRFEGRLDVEVLAQCFRHIALRHEILRTTFERKGDQPVQRIHSGSKIQFLACDLQGLSPDERESRVMSLITKEAGRPFDLAQGPLWRVVLFQLDDEHYILLLTMHHIVSDGWSMGVFIREMTRAYTAYVNGQSPQMSHLPIQYADFAVWQRQWLQGETLVSLVEHWRERLQGAPPMWALPTDRPRPVVHTSRGATYAFTFPQELSTALKALSRREGATLFMTLLSAFAVLLYRYTGQTDIVVGSPIANRHRTEIEGLIGFFVNTLALRINLAGDPSFRTLLEWVRETTLDAYAYQDLPFEKLVEDLQPQRDLGRSPLFQVMFTLQNTPLPALDLPELRMTPVAVDRGTAKFDLTLSIGEIERELMAVFEYNTDLFDESTIVCMQRSFQALLEGIVADPARTLSGFSLVADADRHQLLVEWNDTQAPYPDQCIHHLFESQVERTPDAVAVVDKGQSLTYGELNRRANQLAHHLLALGIGPEDTVGICTRRSLEMVVGILGVLKAGGAYVPLDLTSPPDRLAYMLNDAQASILLTQTNLLEHSPMPMDVVRTVCLDNWGESLENRAFSNPNIPVRPENLAYIVYTSGSTGRPKGVICTHRGSVNYLTYLTRTYPLTGKSIVLQLASLSFDASVRDLIGPLTIGGCVVLVPEAAVYDMPGLLKLVKEYGLTCILSIVPTMLRGLMACACDEDVPYNSVNLLLVSGERLHIADWKRAQTVFGSQLLFVNQYGPTECTMTSSYYPFEVLRGGQGDAPIGRPIPNAQLYILDDDMNPVPIGVPGQLYIGGVGLARGYHGQPALTAAAFLPHPFSDRPGDRLYKTGDRARYRSQGNIEFLGRCDGQIKLRGLRIEVREVEAVLRQHPQVAEAIVAVQETVPDDKQLVGYVVPKSEIVPSIDSLRDFLSRQLPGYMVPATFVFLEALPLLPNGKIDRRSLPEPDSVRSPFERDAVAPRTPVEETLAAIWSRVLGVEGIGVYDDFFALGGHSLLAAQVIARINQAFQIELPLRTIFEETSIAGLAIRIVQVQVEENDVEIAELLAELEALPLEEVPAECSLDGGIDT